MKINLAPSKKHKDTFQWLQTIAVEFFDEHDIEVSNSVWGWLKTQDGCRYFVGWLKGQGWQVEYWELPPYLDPSKNHQPRQIGYGLDFTDTCPKFVEAKLKQ